MDFFNKVAISLLTYCAFRAGCIHAVRQAERFGTNKLNNETDYTLDGRESSSYLELFRKKVSLKTLATLDVCSFKADQLIMECGSNMTVKHFIGTYSADPALEEGCYNIDLQGTSKLFIEGNLNNCTIQMANGSELHVYGSMSNCTITMGGGSTLCVSNELSNSTILPGTHFDPKIAIIYCNKENSLSNEAKVSLKDISENPTKQRWVDLNYVIDLMYEVVLSSTADLSKFCKTVKEYKESIKIEEIKTSITPFISPVASLFHTAQTYINISNARNCISSFASRFTKPKETGDEKEL